MEYGDAAKVKNGLILRVTAGSEALGTAVEGTDDHDEMGIYVEPLADVMRWQPPQKAYTFRTQPEGHRSGPGDTDYVAYPLRRYVELAMKGNPTMLVPLFVSRDFVLQTTIHGNLLREGRHRFLSVQTAERFLGYMRAQRERMIGRGKQNRVPNRPELVEKYGFDCYLDDTEFLTRRGWLTYDEVGDEEVATINEAGQVEFQRPVERVSKPYSGPIHFGRTRYSSWAVTPNHRMWVSKIERGACGVNGDAYAPERADWGFRRADEIQAVSWHQRVAAARRDEEYPVTDAYLALVGAYVSEGCAGKRLTNGDPSVLRFEQKDGGRLHETIALVSSEFALRTYRYPERRPVTVWTLADRGVARDIAKACGEGSHHKHLPDWVQQLSTRQADVLLTALLNGDGTPYRTGGWVYYTVSEQLADDVQALGILAGRRSLRWGPYADAQVYQVYLAEPSDARQMEGFRARRHLRVEYVTDRRIVCFTVPNERLVTRREGKVAMHGNTKYAAHALRLALQAAEVLRTGTLVLPLPDEDRELILKVRRGELHKNDVLRFIDEVEWVCNDRLEKGDHALPREPDRAWISEVVTHIHRAAWGFVQPPF